jgi:thioredoxin reductase (NADPH)
VTVTPATPGSGSGSADPGLTASASAASTPAPPAPAWERPGPRLAESEIRIVGYRWSPRVHRLKDFLARSRVPFRWLDLETDRTALAAVEQALPNATRFPVVLFPEGTVLIDPDVGELAERLGLETHPDGRSYDLLVIGGGPAGLAASIYAASEGLRTVVVEQEVPGGQVSYSSAVENYPGFPEGLSGSELGQRTSQQAERFGVEIVVTHRAVRLRAEGDERLVTLDDGTELVSRTVLLAVGVSFRWLEAPGCPALAGAGIYYGAATAEASACEGQDVYVLGGGNSAGQSALLLAQYAQRVVILALEASLEETMSAYLVDRIRRKRNIVVRTRRTVVGAAGQPRLTHLTIQNVDTGETEVVEADALFAFIGATPSTDWLGDAVARDAQGFILSERDSVQGARDHVAWPLAREPYPLETSTPGVFVAGDVHQGSVKRLASAVGEGAVAVQGIHRYLRPH